MAPEVRDRAVNRSRVRLAAVTTVLVALVALEPAAASPTHGYSLVLMITVAAVALVSAVKLWRTGSVGAQATAGGLAVAVMVGQIIAGTFGTPTGPAAHWSPAALALVALAGVVITVLAFEARGRTQVDVVRREHPYAL